MIRMAPMQTKEEDYKQRLQKNGTMITLQGV